MDVQAIRYIQIFEDKLGFCQMKEPKSGRAAAHPLPLPLIETGLISSNFFWRKDVKVTPKAQVLSVKHCIVIVNYLQCKQPAKILEMVGKRDLSAGNGTTAHATVLSVKNVCYRNLR